MWQQSPDYVTINTIIDSADKDIYIVLGGIQSSRYANIH